MKPVDLILERFGTQGRLARALGLPPSTVSAWRVAGRIPAQHQEAVLSAARRLYIVLEPADFFERSDGEGGAS